MQAPPAPPHGLRVGLERPVDGSERRHVEWFEEGDGPVEDVLLESELLLDK